MIGTAMLYCALWALWLSAAAWMIERVMLKGRGPVRAVWITAVALSVVGPMLGYALSRRSADSVVHKMSALSSAASRSMTTNSLAITHRVQSATIAARFAVVRSAVARADRPLGIAWVALSLALLVYIAGGLVHLSFVRRRWRAGVVNGTRVMISDDSGPALVGVVRSTIVIPEWALGLEPDALALMLRHELEHQSAGDTRMLAVAETLLMLMPWNPMLWWQLRRLRLAIELDCDARVLRAVPDVGLYGRLLLEFGRQHREMHFAGAALAGHASHLEERIRRMTRRPAMGRGKAAVVSCIAGVVAIVVGCQLPAPAPAAPAVKANVVALTPADQSRADSAALTDATKYDALLTLYDSSRVRGQDADRRLRRLRQDAEQTYMDFKIPDSRIRVPTEQTYMELQIALDRLTEASKQLSQSRNGATLADEMRTLSERLSSVQSDSDLQAAAEKLRALSQNLSDRPLKNYLDGRPMSGDSLFFLSDSAAAAQRSPGCSASARDDGSALLKLLVSDEDGMRAGFIAVTSAAATESGAKIEFGTGLSCRYSRTGELRLYGRGAFDGASIVVRTSTAISVVVMTGSGRILAGPVVVQNDSRQYELTWSPR